MPWWQVVQLALGASPSGTQPVVRIGRQQRVEIGGVQVTHHPDAVPCRGALRRALSQAEKERLLWQ